MTVPVQTIFSASVANGVTTSFPYAFKITDSEDLQVSVDGVVQTTGFTVSGVGNELGGNVVFSVAPANGAKVLRYLVPVLKREVDYQQFGDWLAEVVNNEFDRIWLATQAFKQDGLRALKLPVDTETDQVIALDAADRANKAVVFDADGNVTVSTDDYDDQLANVTAQAAAAAVSAASASTSASTATTQASNASTSASTASTQASTATTQAGIATTKAGEAATSAAAALVSENNAADSLADALAIYGSIAAVEAAEAAAAASAAAALTSEGNAATSASSASTSASIATTQASNASTSASSAASSASSATGSSSAASASETAAAASASSASSSATSAASSATAAANSAASAAAIVTGSTVAAGNGAVGTPSFTFGSDTDTGLYRIGANNLGIAVGGTKIVDASAAGVTVSSLLSLSGPVDNYLTIKSTTTGYTAMSGGVASTGGGIKLTAGALNASAKYIQPIVWGSTDADLVTANPKYGAAIAAYATEAFTADTAGGMGLEFFGVPNAPGAAQPALTSLGTWDTTALTLASGVNLVLASGKGIDFSATSNGSGTTSSEILSDYEEGTFTPVVAGDGVAGVGTYTTQVGSYTKIGNRVFFSINLNWTAHTGTGNLKITGLPFTSANVAGLAHAVTATYINNLALSASNILTPYIGQNDSVIWLNQSPIGAGGSVTQVPMDTSAQFGLSGSYIV